MSILTESSGQVLACPRCDTLAYSPRVHEGQKVLCHCCGSKIMAFKQNSIERTLALAVAGLIVALPAIFLPIIGVGFVGFYHQASLFDSILHLFDRGYWLIAFAVFLFTAAIPLIKLSGAFYLTWSIKRKRPKPALMKFFRSYHHLDSWTMLHVFVLGVVVSMYKLVDMADLSIGYGFAAFVFLQLCSTLVTVTLDHHYIWHYLEHHVDE